MLTSIVTPAGYRVDASGKWIYSSPEETIFGNFIQNGEYKQYIADWYADPAKYGYLDIDGDGKKELIITRVLSEFWVFQEKVDMKVSAFSFTTSLLVFGYL